MERNVTGCKPPLGGWPGVCARGSSRGLDGCLRRTMDVKRPEQHPASGGHILNRPLKGCLIGLRRSVKSADLPDKLERRVVELVIRGLAIGLAQPFDVSAHRWTFLR